MRTNSMTALFGAAVSLMAMNAQAALVSTDGGLGVHDTTNNVTWASDGNLFYDQEMASGNAANFVQQVINDAGGSVTSVSGTHTLSASADFYVPTGEMTYFGAKAWVNYLDSINYGGSNLWALPTTIDDPSSGGFPDGAPGNPSPSSSQLATLFYGGLGQVAGQNIANIHNANYALFQNLQSYAYWSATPAYGPSYLNSAWVFYGESGSQGFNSVSSFAYALPVVGPPPVVPLPAAVWLLLSGLAGLGALARKQRVAASPV